MSRMRRAPAVLGPFFAVLLSASAGAFVACGPPATAPPEAPRPTASASASASAPAPAIPAGMTAAQVDALLDAAWQKEGLSPAAPADDATFLRRVYLDLVGTIPPADVARAFVADPAPDNRANEGRYDGPPDTDTDGSCQCFE